MYTAFIKLANELSFITSDNEAGKTRKVIQRLKSCQHFSTVPLIECFSSAELSGDNQNSYDLPLYIHDLL